jgi:dienelactone hydrolase
LDEFAPAVDLIPKVTVHLYVPNAPGLYPVVEFAHHFDGSKADYENWGALLASRGFLVALADNRGQVDAYDDRQGHSSANSTDNPSVNVEAADLLRILNWATSESRTDAASPLYRKVDSDHLALVGNSVGGYNTSLATYLSDTHLKDPVTGQPWPRISALVALDPVGVDESKNVPGFDDSFVYPNLTTPTAVLSGEEDEFPAPNSALGLCDEGYDHLSCYLGANQQFVALSPATPKLGLKIVCSHHLWAEDPNDDDGTAFGSDVQFDDAGLKAACASRTAGQPQFAPSPLPDPAGVRMWKRYTMAWLEYWLQGDCRVAPYLAGSAFARDQSAGLITRLPADKLPSQTYYTANPNHMTSSRVPNCSRRPRR